MTPRRRLRAFVLLLGAIGELGGKAAGYDVQLEAPLAALRTVMDLSASDPTPANQLALQDAQKTVAEVTQKHAATSEQSERRARAVPVFR